MTSGGRGHAARRRRNATPGLRHDLLTFRGVVYALLRLRWKGGTRSSQDSSPSIVDVEGPSRSLRPVCGTQRADG